MVPVVELELEVVREAEDVVDEVEVVLAVVRELEDVVNELELELLIELKLLIELEVDDAELPPGPEAEMAPPSVRTYSNPMLNW